MAKWQWCLEGDSGVLLKGWQRIGDYWYYLNPNGVMVTGWIQSNNLWYYLDGATGRMLTGWQKIDNKDYCFASDGSLYVNTTTPDGYMVDEKGVWINSLVSDSLIDFVKSFEGFSATKYQDEVGVWTLGYGMTGEEIENLTTVTEEQATQMVKNWINKKYAPVIKSGLNNVVLKQNEFDALVSMAYNVGTAGVLGSTLFKNVVAGVRDADIITSNFQAWSNASGQRLEGLYRRRTKEANIFLNGDYTGNN